MKHLNTRFNSLETISEDISNYLSRGKAVVTEHGYEYYRDPDVIITKHWTLVWPMPKNYRGDIFEIPKSAEWDAGNLNLEHSSGT